MVGRGTMAKVVLVCDGLGGNFAVVLYFVGWSSEYVVELDFCCKNNPLRYCKAFEDAIDDDDVSTLVSIYTSGDPS